MKIAIVTQPLGHNIGGIIQNWALHKTLQSLGHEPITINYMEKWKISAKDRFRIPARNMRTFLRRLQKRHDRYMRLSDTIPQAENIRFINSHINVTAPCRQYRAVDDCDFYIVGSDQVWRPRYNKLTLADSFFRFLGDSDVPRIAYAASFGTDSWEYTPEQSEECRGLAAKFKAISVREDSGVDLCRKYLGCDAKLVADPTLLLDADSYLPLCNGDSGSKCVVSYFLDINSHKLQLAENAAESLGRKHYDLHPRRSSVNNWLTSIKNSDFVITDSFHGTVFAIIFRRNFAVVSNNKRGNSRLYSLLGKLGMSDRITDDAKNLELILNKQADWAYAERQLNEMKAVSIDFLKKSLA